MDAPGLVIGTGDGLRAWHHEPLHGLDDHRVDHVVVAEDGVWVLVDGTSVFRSGDSGISEKATDISGERANCLLVTDGRILVGTSRAGLYEWRAGQLQRSRAFDTAPGRDSWYTPWGGPPDVRSMARGVEGNLYVNVHVGGVVRSTDDGGSWMDTMDINADVHQVVADPDVPARAYAAAAVGLGITTDGGDTWRFLTDGLHGSYCRAVATSAASVFVSASLGSNGRHAALYRGPRDGDGPLTRCTVGLPEWFSTNLDTFCLAAEGDFVAAGDASGIVYVSHDDGATWEAALTGLPDVTCLALL